MGRFGSSPHGGAAFTALLGLCAIWLAWSPAPRAAPQDRSMVLPTGGVAQIIYVGNAPIRLLQSVQFAPRLAAIRWLTARMDVPFDDLTQQTALLGLQSWSIQGELERRVDRAVPVMALYTPAD